MARSIRYCTADDDVRILLAKVTDAVAGDSTVEYLIDIICDTIDARLHYMYTVPFTTTPPLIKAIATHGASYFVLRRINAKTVGTDEGAWVEVYREFADSLLEGLFNGTLTLLDASGDMIGRKSDYGMKISTAKYTPIFNEGDDLDWEIDEDKVDDATKGR